MKPPIGIVSPLIFIVAVCSAQTESKSTPLAPTPAVAPAAASAGQPPPAPAADSPTGKYVIGPLDVLEIKVWHNPDVSGFFDVRPDGFISMPLIGEFKADGLTVADLTRVVREKLSAQINEPDVNIQPSRMNSKKIFVHGGVNKQGEMPLTSEMTVLDALSNCGGFRDFSDPKKIYVLRAGKQLKFNYNDVKKGKHMEQNIVLQNGDHIFVPE